MNVEMETPRSLRPELNIEQQSSRSLVLSMMNETPRELPSYAPDGDEPEQRRETAVDGLDDERISPLGLNSA